MENKNIGNTILEEWSTETVEPKSKKWIWIIVAAVVVVALAVGAFFLFPGLVSKEEEPVAQVERRTDLNYFDEKDLDKIYEESYNIILKEPHNVEARLDLVKVAAQRGNLEEARDQIDIIAGLVPTDFRIYDLMVEIYEVSGKYIQAALFIENISVDVRSRYKEELRKKGDPLFAGFANTQGNLANDGLVCITDDAIYYSEFRDGKALYKADLNGENKVKLADVAAKDINVVGNTVFFVGVDDYKIYSVKTTGGKHKLLIDCFGQRLFVIGNRLYYVNWADGCKIYSAKFDGSDVKMAIDVSADHVTLAGGWIYYQDRDQMEAIGRVKINGEGKELLNEVNCTYINSSGDYIYYANWGDEGKLYRCLNDMSQDPEPLTESKVGYINIYGDWIYYIDWVKDQNIYRKHITNGTVECISEDIAQYLFVKGNYVYYYNELEGNKLFRIDLDGSNRVQISD